MKPCNKKRDRVTEATGRQKRLKLPLNDIRVDRISNLPVDVIGHMLSFLPTKYAVGTSVLSSSWEKHWTAIRNFHFDDQPLFDLQKYQEDRSIPFTERRWQRVLNRAGLLNFVNRVFSQTKGSVLSSFYMQIRHPIEKEEFEQLDEWLHKALTRGVRQIDVRIPCYLTYHDEFGTLLLQLVACMDLEVLKLGEAFILEIPHHVSLPNLKVLKLYNIEISGDAASRLLSSCPKLEDLTFESVRFTDMSGLNISAPALRNLELCVCPPCKGFKIAINTPNLTLFNFCDETLGSLYSVLSVECPLSLVKAEIDLKDCEERQSETTIRLLHSIAEKVQIFHSPSGTLEAFSCCSRRRWPTFLHLTHLEFCNKVRFLVISMGCLLRAENLKTLVFKKSYFCRKFNSNWFRATSLWLKDRPPYFFNLKEISIACFSGDEAEIDVLNYLLEKAVVLEKLEIKYYSFIDQGKSPSLAEKLLALPVPKNFELVAM